jgi:hypothetical protein
MSLRGNVRQAVSGAAELRPATDGVLLYSLRTQLRIIRSICALAAGETGSQRARRLQQAKRCLLTALEVSKHVTLGCDDRDAFEQARRDIRSLKKLQSSPQASSPAP